MSERSARLPIYQCDEFPVGAQVRLRSDSSGAAGVVEGMCRGRVIVRWPIDGEGKHRPDALIAVEQSTAAKERPYDRLLRKLREEREGRAGK